MIPRYAPRRYKRTVAGQARYEAMKLAAKRRRPYRGKYPVVTDYGVVPYYQSEFVLAQRIRHERAVFQATCDEWARKGWGDYAAQFEAFGKRLLDSIFTVTDETEQK